MGEMYDILTHVEPICVITCTAERDNDSLTFKVGYRVADVFLFTV